MFGHRLCWQHRRPDQPADRRERSEDIDRRRCHDRGTFARARLGSAVLAAQAQGAPRVRYVPPLEAPREVYVGHAGGVRGAGAAAAHGCYAPAALASPSCCSRGRCQQRSHTPIGTTFGGSGAPAPPMPPLSRGTYGFGRVGTLKDTKVSGPCWPTQDYRFSTAKLIRSSPSERVAESTQSSTTCVDRGERGAVP